MDFLVQENDHCPVTVLFYYGDLLLAGEGPFLRVYQRTTRKLLLTSRVFASQHVHGIVCQDVGILGGLILVWGGPLVRVTSVVRSAAHPSPPQLCLGPLLGAPDWILSIEFAPSPHHDSAVAGAALVTAHNTLYYISIDETIYEVAQEPSQNRLHASLGELTSTSRCMLYSAHLFWLSQSRVLVASGTVFGEIRVWSCELGVNGTGNGNSCTSYRAQLHDVLPGHAGSIFGVRISPELNWSNHNGPCRLLASCSDDRTIRIWDISELPDHRDSVEPGATPDSVEHRQTGFAAKPSATAGQDSYSNYVAMAWGHASRIWSVLFLGHRTTIIDALEPLRLVSRGEDGTCQYWVLSALDSKMKDDLGKASNLSVKHERTCAHHNGKNLWSMATSSSSDWSGNVATGGADGRIVTYVDLPWSSLGSTSLVVEEQWLVDEVLQALGHEPVDTNVVQQDTLTPLDASSSSQGGPGSELVAANTSCKALSLTSQDHGYPACMANIEGTQAVNAVHKDALKSYAFLKGGDLVVTSRAGNVWLASARQTTSMMEGRHLTWRKLGQYDDILSYSVSTSIKSQDIAFIAGVTGAVLCYDNVFRSLFEVCSTDGKVAGLFAQELGSTSATFLPTRTLSNEKIIVLLVTHVGITTADIVVLGISSTPFKRSISVQSTVRLQLPADFIVTSMATRSVDQNRKILYLGGRNGHVGCCSIEKSSLLADVCDEGTHPVMWLFDDRTAKDAITSLTWIGLDASDISATVSYLMSTARDGTYAIRQLSENCSGSIIHRSTLPFGPNIEGAYLSKAGQLLLYGFRSKHFVLWDETNHDELMTVDCGGSHRNWAFQPAELSDGSTGGIFVWTQASIMHIYSSNAPSHQVIKPGGHGREVKAVAVRPSTDAKRLFATGAEDTDVRIFELAAKGDEVTPFRCLRILRKHNTGIQHLQWSEDGSFLFSSGGFEEFLVWRVRRVPVIDIGVVCESICPPESILPDLRITNFVVREMATPELVHGDAAFLISMVYSDSTVRVYQYTSTAAAKQWTLLVAGNYLSSCLTQCTFLPHDGFLGLLTAGTDGHIALWDLNIAPPLHPSNNTSQPSSPPSSATSAVGILEWHVRHKIHQNTIKCLTQTRLDHSTYMAVTGGDDNALGITLLNSHSPAATLLIPRAHAAAITGVALFKVPFHAMDREGGKSSKVDKDSLQHNNVEAEGERLTRFRALTAGNDQRVKLWEISIDLDKRGVEGVDVRRLANRYSAVADISDMDQLWDDKGWRVVMCGVGMEVWRVEARARGGLFQE